MKPSTELFDLVKSLSKSEKRFFKLSSTLQQGDKNYIKVFDVIERQDEYDEDAIRAEFEGEAFVKHLPSVKNNLYRLILKSLRAFHSDNSISGILKQDIKNIEILYNKALFRECNKMLMKAKKMAVDYEKFYYLFELLSWEKILLEEAYESGEFSKDIDGLIKEEQEVIEKLRNLAAYHVLYSKINYLFRSGGYVRSETDRALVEEISHHPLIVGRNTALSYRAATICYYIQGFCATANVDKHTAMLKFKKVRDILDGNPAIRKDLPQRYMRTLSNILNLQVELNLFDEAEETIASMRAIAKKQGYNSADIEVLVFRSTHLAEIKLYEKQGRYDEALVVVDQIVSHLDTNNSKFNKEHELHFLNAIASVYFGAGRFKDSLQWLNRVLNDNENHLRQDIYSYARLFNLLVHYEIGNYDLLEFMVKSTMRYLSKRQRDFDLEISIIKFMRRLGRIGEDGDPMPIFKEFDEYLSESLKYDNNRIILSYFNYPLWVKSKLKGLSLAEATLQYQPTRVGV